MYCGKTRASPQKKSNTKKILKLKKRSKNVQESKSLRFKKNLKQFFSYLKNLIKKEKNSCRKNLFY